MELRIIAKTDKRWVGSRLAVAFLAAFLLTSVPLSVQAVGSRSPLGLWKTFDDKTGMPRALVAPGSAR